MKTFAIMAILAMFCLAGVVSAETTTVGGSIGAALGSTSSTTISGLNLDPTHSPVTATFTVSGSANANVQLTVTSPQNVLKLQPGDSIYLSSVMTISPTIAVVTPASGAWSQVFTISQPVAFADPVGDYEGTITVTVALA